MATTQKTSMTKVVTGKVRLSYAHLFEPHAFDSAPDKKQFSVCLLIKKTDKATIEKISRAIEAAKIEGKTSKWNNKLPGKLWNPLRDGDVEHPEDEAFIGHYFLNAKSNQKPGIVDINLNQILDKDEVYSGCYGRVSIVFFPYAVSGSAGIGVALNNVQKVADGEPLSGRSAADEDFSEEFTDDDDLLG